MLQTIVSYLDVTPESDRRRVARREPRAMVACATITAPDLAVLTSVTVYGIRAQI